VGESRVNEWAEEEGGRTVIDLRPLVAGGLLASRKGGGRKTSGERAVQIKIMVVLVDPI